MQLLWIQFQHPISLYCTPVPDSKAHHMKFQWTILCQIWQIKLYWYQMKLHCNTCHHIALHWRALNSILEYTCSPNAHSHTVLPGLHTMYFTSSTTCWLTASYILNSLESLKAVQSHLIRLLALQKKLYSNITWHDVSLRYFAPAWLVAVNKILVWTDIAEFQEVPLIACKIHENNSLDKTWTNNAHLRDHTCFGNIAEIWRGSNHVSSSLFFLYLPPGQVFVSVAGGSTKQITYAEGMPSYANRVNMLKVSYGVAPAA